MDIANDVTVTSVSDSATSVALIAATALGRARKGVIIHNNSTEILYIRYGGTAATVAAGGYTVQVPASIHWIMDEPIFQGALWGIWANNSTGAASITEIY